MKAFRIFILSSLGFLVSLIGYRSLEARDLTYKFSAGWQQTYVNARVNDATNAFSAVQLNGLDVSYGVAKDFFVGAFFGFEGNFDFAAMGPKFRYDLQRLMNRDAAVWKYVNIFTQVSFLAKFGKETKAGILLQAPYLGVEILPFSDVNLAISSSAGLAIDFVEENRVGFTQGLLGDLGLRYYF